MLAFTVSIQSAGVTYGDSPVALFRRGGGGGKFFPRSRQGACCPTFVEPADPKAGSRDRPTVVRSSATLGRADRGGAVFARLRAADPRVNRRCPALCR